MNVFKIFRNVSIICAAIGLALLCSVNVDKHAPMSTFLAVYGVLIAIFAFGAVGVYLTEDEERFPSIKFGLEYAVRCIQDGYRVSGKNLIQSFKIFYQDGKYLYFE